MRSKLALAGVLALSACAQVQSGMVDAETAAATGQLICQTGTTFVALTNAAGVPVLAKGAKAADVLQACALLNAVPVALPAGTIAAPVAVAS